MNDRFSDRVLGWFDVHGRKDLPWQQDISAYRVWVSEIMLQQTQVTTVIPFFERFVARLPTVQALAAADEDTVLHYWTGLGYYARARNLHRSAREIVTNHGGQLPMTLDGLLALPGIGRSTAGAIIAIAGDQRGVILDGNVKRVLARHFAVEGWLGERTVADALWQLADQTTPHQRVADYTQAIMDLGATVCMRQPQCGDCPVQQTCLACRTQTTAQYPGRKPRKEKPVKTTRMLIIENPEGEVLLLQRPPTGLWGGLWSFPECDDQNAFMADHGLTMVEEIALQPFRHSFTHYHLDITPMQVRVDTPNASTVAEASARWVLPQSPPPIGFTRPVTRIFEALYSNSLL